MAKQQTGSSAKLWRALLKEGGRLTVNEVAQIAEDISGVDARSILNGMVLTGSVRKFDGPKYGVTPACKVPQGITVGELLEAVDRGELLA